MHLLKLLTCIPRKRDEIIGRSSGYCSVTGFLKRCLRVMIDGLSIRDLMTIIKLITMKN
jgi:predicted AlkP superfamily pyrophosphatase or phosphodiesterase